MRMADSIEDLPEFKAYFNFLSVEEVKQTFKLNCLDYRKTTSYLTRLNSGKPFIYTCESNIDLEKYYLRIKFPFTSNSKTIELEIFSLPKQHQNKKQGLVTLARTLMLAQNLKVDKITLLATSSTQYNAIGGYYWAAHGAEPLIPFPITLRDILDDYKIHLQNTGLDCSSVADINTLYDLSQDGRRPQSDETWPGKAFLLNQAWAGGWDLNDPMQMRRTYNVINQRLQNLLLETITKKNDLFSSEEITKLLDQTQACEQQQEKKERALFNTNTDAISLYKSYESSAVNPTTIKAVALFINQVNKKNQTNINKNYPKLARHHQQVNNIIQKINQQQKINTYIHAKITALMIERHLGKSVLELFSQKPKNKDRGR